MSKALLIVDVQNDFCPGGALAVKDGDAVVPPLNKMIEHARKNNWLVIASRDWHPPVTKHFKNYGGLWPAHCVQNTPGAEFHPDLRIQGAAIISKGVKADADDYSAFDGRTITEKSLAEFLKERNIEELYVGGLATDYCVKASVLDALKRGFKTHFLIDACRAVNINSGDGAKAVEEMRQAGAVISSVPTVCR
jgi:nicotinamidase/pyrazinamidase